MADINSTCSTPTEDQSSAGLNRRQGNRGGGGIFKSAAVAVLRSEGRLMTTGEITRMALDQALIKCQGRTPEATMASALYTDVKRKHDKSVFTRPQEGLFGLREWGSEGQHAPCSAPLQPDTDLHEDAAEIENLSPVRIAVAGHDCENGPLVPDLSPRRGPPAAALCESPIRLLQPEHHARMAPIEALLGHRSTLFPEPGSFASHASMSYVPFQQSSGANEPSTSAIGSMLSQTEAGRLYSNESVLSQRILHQNALVRSLSAAKRMRSRSASPPKFPKLAAVEHGSLTPGPLNSMHGAMHQFGATTPSLDELLQDPCSQMSPCMQWLRLFRGNSMTGGGKDLEDLTAAQASMHGRDEEASESGAAAADSMHELGHELQTSSSAGICCAEEEVRGLEHRLGTAHPRVGKAWLQLSRAYQQAGGEANVAKSEQALLRAWHICSRFYVHSQHPPNPFNSSAPANRLEQQEPDPIGSGLSAASHQERPESASGTHLQAACFTHDFLI